MSTEAIEGQSRPIIGVRVMVLNIVITVGLALGITALFGREPLVQVLLRDKPWPIQGAWGIAIGFLVTVPAGVLISSVPWFVAFRRQLIELVSRADLNGFNPLWISLCAGVGEETLFRGALQPLLGLWVTSLIWTVLHYQTGGFRTMNRMKAVYAVLVFLASVLLGIVFVQIGLIAAMVAHTVIDLVALTMLRSARR
jgi:membrane protease YdiL (CAAX protease family)